MGLLIADPTAFSQCDYNAQYKELILNGRLQEYSATKELIRQIPLFIDSTLTNMKDWLFQRTLTSTTPTAVFPNSATTQFVFTNTSTQPLNSVDGPDDINYLQPNFLYIATDSPVLVTFGYCPVSSQTFKDPTNPTNNLTTQPANLNLNQTINGYFVRHGTRNNLKIAPQTTADETAWVYSGQLGGTANGSWGQALGHSDTAITFPIFIQKSSRITKSHIVIYAAVLSS